MSFTEKFRDRIEILRKFTLELNFRACYNATTDMIRSSEFIDYPEGVFIGEILQSLFYFDIRSLNDEYEISQDHLEKIKKIVMPVIDYVRLNLPLNSNGKKSEFYILLMNSRYALTKLQIEYWREKTPVNEIDDVDDEE